MIAGSCRIGIRTESKETAERLAFLQKTKVRRVHIYTSYVGL